MGNIRNNLYGHTSREELLYGNRSREAVLYDERIQTRPSSSRLKAIGKMLAGKAAESVIKKVPDAQGNSTLASIYNGMKNGLRQTAGAYKHNNGIEAFKNSIPGTKRVVQNFWSLYHLKDGVTTIDSFYTVERAGNEYTLAVQKDNESVDFNSLKNIASKINGNEIDHHNSVIRNAITGRYDDWNAEKAQIYAELTDKDSLKKAMLEPKSFKPVYQKAELKFIGAIGKKTAIGQTSSGETIYKYTKPSASNFLKFYTMMDVYYTAITTTAHAAENLLEGVALQDIFTRESTRSAKLALRSYGIIPSNFADIIMRNDVDILEIPMSRYDGVANPIQLYR